MPPSPAERLTGDSLGRGGLPSGHVPEDETSEIHVGDPRVKRRGRFGVSSSVHCVDRVPQQIPNLEEIGLAGALWEGRKRRLSIGRAQQGFRKCDEKGRPMCVSFKGRLDY